MAVSTAVVQRLAPAAMSGNNLCVHSKSRTGWLTVCVFNLSRMAERKVNLVGNTPRGSSPVMSPSSCDFSSQTSSPISFY